MNRKTIRRRRAPVADSLTDQHPLIARVLANRGIDDPAGLEHGLADLHPPDTLGGLAPALDLLQQALDTQQHVMIVGDFDADGATSTALAIKLLREFGLENVSYRVPDRFRFGYGLTEAIVEDILPRHPHLIITVDNGVSSIGGVARARAAGIAVLVTDHHLPAQSLPAANAIVNPNLDGDGFPSKCLAGVGVLFYLLVALRNRLQQTGWFARTGRTAPNLADYLDLVALGTVADVVPLDRNNRILVEQGLRRIRAGRCLPGIRALLELANRDIRRVNASDLGFAVGPRLNAAGRLDDMSLGIECLLCEEQSRALQKARILDDLNRERRSIEAGMQAQAVTILNELQQTLPSRQLPPALVLHDTDWHPGVVGIVAGRIKDRFNRPVIAFADAEDGEVKGSARSVAGLHIRDVLDTVASRNPGLLSRFGGHAMAAGMSLAGDRLADFTAAFIATVGEIRGEASIDAEIMTDGELAAADFDMELADRLRFLAPWGQQFPEPCFDGEFECCGVQIMAERHLKLQLRNPADGGLLTAIAFNWIDADAIVPEVGQTLSLVYRLDVNEYRGRRSLQLLVEHLQAAR